MTTIIIAGAEPNQQVLYQMELEDEGYRVLTACDGREALKIIEQTCPDLVVLDPHTRGQKGASVFQLIKNTAPELPVLVYTGNLISIKDDPPWPADVHLTKTSNLDPLKRMVARMLDQRHDPAQRSHEWTHQPF